MQDSKADDARASERGDLHLAEVRRVTLVGLVANLWLAALKFSVGALGSSQAVVADAIHSLSDTITDMAILLGVSYWSAPADECHPYGHRRIETMVTLLIGGILAAAAIGLSYRALAALRSGDLKQPGWIALAGAGTSIVVKEILYRWTAAVGKRVRSSALMANAWHHRSDVLSSIPAALSVVAGAVNPAWALVDKVGALIVSLFVLHAAVRIIRPALVELSDAGAPRQTRAQIHQLGLSAGEVRSIHAIRTRRMGSGFFVDLHATVDGSMSVSRGHDIAEAVKRRILESLPGVLDVVVHLEPNDHGTADTEFTRKPSS